MLVGRTCRITWHFSKLNNKTAFPTFAAQANKLTNTQTHRHINTHTVETTQYLWRGGVILVDMRLQGRRGERKGTAGRSEAGQLNISSVNNCAHLHFWVDKEGRGRGRPGGKEGGKG